MPLYDYECPVCGRIEENVLQKFEDPPITCMEHQTDSKENTSRCDGVMVRLIGLSTFKCKGEGFPDQDSKVLKERFVKRNARIEKMDPLAQQRLKNIIDSTGGKRYIP